MSRPAITVENLSKSYRISHQARVLPTLRESLMNAIRSPWQRRAGQEGSTSEETFWALNDVSFEIGRGEVVGIIGRNGAGKSTLLKILSRITEPTRGEVRLRGRVSSLLEVGTGFHPELTGRENIYLNGSILGMRKAEIDCKFDEIVAFSEVERFLDTPVKHYSSGMYVRLAFAVAAHLEPQILIVDEVLAVGDANFQKKCMTKMEQAYQEGRTILLVSHQLQVIQALTTRAILLESGQIKKIGPTPDVVATYLGASHGRFDLRKIQKASSREATLTYLDIETCNDDLQSSVILGEDLRIRFSVRVFHEIRRFNAAIVIRNSDGVDLFSHTWKDEHKQTLDLGPGTYSFCIRIPTGFLRPGPYWLTLNLMKNDFDALTEVTGIDLPTVVLGPDADAGLESRRWGVVFVPCRWEFQADEGLLAAGVSDRAGELQDDGRGAP
jgi:lipopolysaccharide transport system ATP-binding protein